MAKLSDIIKEIDDECTVQFLHESTVKIVDKKRTADTEITFATNEVNCNTFDGDKVGIVVWLSKDMYNTAVSKLNKRIEKA